MKVTRIQSVYHSVWVHNLTLTKPNCFIYIYIYNEIYIYMGYIYIYIFFSFCNISTSYSGGHHQTMKKRHLYRFLTQSVHHLQGTTSKIWNQLPYLLFYFKSAWKVITNIRYNMQTFVIMIKIRLHISIRVIKQRSLLPHDKNHYRQRFQRHDSWDVRQPVFWKKKKKSRD